MAVFAISWWMMAISLKPRDDLPPNAVRALRKARGMTLEELGAAIGTDARTVQRIETGAMRLSDKWIGPIAEALHVAAGELLLSPGAPELETIIERMPKPEPKPRREVRPADVQLPDRLSMPKDVPVMGTAAGSHLRGAFQLDTHAIDMVRRPPALMNVPNAYALYIEGDSMYPEHNNGDLRFIHPGRPIKLGDSVIVQMMVNPKDGLEATIGRLAKRTERGVTLQKLNPPAEVLLERRFITALHKVLTLNELFGV